jgi:hypothetical protein
MKFRDYIDHPQEDENRIFEAVDRNPTRILWVRFNGKNHPLDFKLEITYNYASRSYPTYTKEIKKNQDEMGIKIYFEERAALAGDWINDFTKEISNNNADKKLAMNIFKTLADNTEMDRSKLFELIKKKYNTTVKA